MFSFSLSNPFLSRREKKSQPPKMSAVLLTDLSHLSSNLAPHILPDISIILSILSKPAEVDLMLPPRVGPWAAHWTQQDLVLADKLEDDVKAATEAMYRATANSIDHWRAALARVHARIGLVELRWKLQRKWFMGRRTQRATGGFAEARTTFERFRAQCELHRDMIEDHLLRFKVRDSVLALLKEGEKPLARGTIIPKLAEIPVKVGPKAMTELAINLMKAYGTMTVGNTELVWDVVRGEWKMQYGVIATHIGPFSYGREILGYLRGLPQSMTININDADNGLCLPIIVAKAVFDFCVTFVPDVATSENPDQPREWKLIVANKAKVWDSLAYEGTTFGDLHNKRLSFPADKDFRPNADYIYLHYQMSVFAFLRYAKCELEEDPESPALMGVPGLMTAWQDPKVDCPDAVQSMFREAMAKVQKELYECQMMVETEPSVESLQAGDSEMALD
jgi:hypothetical protein